MRIKICLTFCSLLLVSALVFAHDEQPAHPDGIVAQCFDGDTIKLKDRRVVRLAGIDAPEAPHKEKKAQFYSRRSKKALEELVSGKQVKLAFPGINIKDRNGRLVADISLPDGQSINEELVREGAAFFYPHEDLNPEFQERLLNAQAEAIKERRGFWDKLLSLPLAKETYVGNRMSLRFIPEDCPAVQNIKPRNRVHFGTLMDAFLAGYAPARICVFWPDAETVH